jgi:hypothetical protein
MKSLKISEDITLPLEAVTETFCILAMRGKGKTHAGSVMAEEMLKVQIPVVVFDPMGVWWGLKSSLNGKSAAFPVSIFGGEHADVPLEYTAGETVAKAIVKNRYAAILDCSLMRKGKRVTFMADFLEALYHHNREAMHFFGDEIHMIAPQMMRDKGGDLSRCLGAVEDVILQGRVRGIGATVISQRPAMVNTTVRTQCSSLIAMGMTGPHDIKAVMEWVNVHASAEQAAEMLKSLPPLPRGDAWFWSPSAFEIFKRIHFRQRETFDSSRTPKVGEARLVPKVLAMPDLQKLGQDIAATIEHAKENDPAALKRQVAALKQELATASKPVVESKPEPVLTDEDRRQIAKASELSAGIVATMEKENAKLIDSILDIKKFLGGIDAKLKAHTGAQLGTANRQLPAAVRNIRALPPRMQPAETNGALSKCERSILIALAQYPSGRTASQAAILAGYSVNSGGFNNALSRLRTSEYISRGQPMQITEAGSQVLGEFQPLPTGRDLAVHWISQLSKCEALILQTLVEAYPQAMTAAEVAAATGYSADSGGFNNSLSRLRTLELITRGQPMKASDDLFQ